MLPTIPSCPCCPSLLLTRSTTLIGIYLSAAVQLQAQSTIPGPSFEDVIGLHTAAAVAVAPDGKTVAYVVRTADWKDNRFDSEIWLARAGRSPLQLTRNELGNSTTPRWSPDGRWIGFLSDRGKKTQIYLIPAEGGEARALTAVDDGVTDFQWAPDGKTIAFTQPDPQPDRERRKKRYGEFAVEDQEYAQNHLWLIDVAAEPTAVPTPRRLTQGGQFTVNNFSWSPDGDRIAFESRPDPLINSSARADISIVQVAGGEVRPLVTNPGADLEPVWSPDGKWILYRTTAGDTTSNFYRNARLSRIPATGGSQVRLAADLDENPAVVCWTPTGIYLGAWQKTKRQIFRLDPESGKTTPLSTTPNAIFATDCTRDGRTLAFVGQDASKLPEVYLTETTQFAPVLLTDQTRQIADWRIGTSEVVSWKSKDGATIEGVLHKPRGFDPNHRYPLFVVIHGGPTGIDAPSPVVGYVYPVMEWLAKGALVLRPNYRGSSGYGEAFRSLNVRNLGIGDAWDVLSGVDYLIRQGSVDTTRMAAMGWSQGGYISAFLTTNTTRFKAISVGAGISDWMTYYVNTDIHPFTRQYLKATPWDDPAIYAATSPITSIKHARTPTLIQHGELDRRVPIANAYELFQGLQDVGVETRLVVYKGFGHGIDKPKEQLAAMWHNWQWFARLIWGENIELPLPADSTVAAVRP